MHLKMSKYALKKARNFILCRTFFFRYLEIHFNNFEVDIGTTDVSYLLYAHCDGGHYYRIH